MLFVTAGTYDAVKFRAPVTLVGAESGPTIRKAAGSDATAGIELLFDGFSNATIRGIAAERYRVGIDGRAIFNEWRLHDVDVEDNGIGLLSNVSYHGAPVTSDVCRHPGTAGPVTGVASPQSSADRGPSRRCS